MPVAFLVLTITMLAGALDVGTTTRDSSQIDSAIANLSADSWQTPIRVGLGKSSTSPWRRRRTGLEKGFRSERLRVPDMRR